MALVPIELPTASRPGTIGPDGLVRLINCRAQDAGRAGKIRFPLYAAPGLKPFATMANGNGIRGILATETDLLVVAGTRLFRFDSFGNGTDVGGIAGTGPAYLARNRKSPLQVGIVSEGVPYIYESDALTPLADPDLPPPLDISFVDGYFLFAIEDGRFFTTSIDEGTQIDPLDFASAEASPDGLVRGYARSRDVILFGTRTIEFWANTGALGFPFENIEGSTVQIGLGHGASVAALDDVVAFVADDDTVRMLSGYSPQIISNQSVQDAISRETGEIRGWSYTLEGNSFYVLSGTVFTWVFDFNLAQKVGPEDAWHERQSFGLDRWRGEQFAQFAGRRIVGDFENNALYELDADTHGENGADLVMTVQVPVHAYPNRLTMNALFVDFAPGVGLNTTDPHDEAPKAMLRVSRDGGDTFGPAFLRDIGVQGSSRTRTVARRLGDCGEDGFVIEASVSAAVARALTGAAADIDQLEA